MAHPAEPIIAAKAEVTVVEMLPEHWFAVERIYAEGIATGDATFELQPPLWDDFDLEHLAMLIGAERAEAV